MMRDTKQVGRFYCGCRVPTRHPALGKDAYRLITSSESHNAANTAVTVVVLPFKNMQLVHAKGGVPGWVSSNFSSMSCKDCVD